MFLKRHTLYSKYENRFSGDGSYIKCEIFRDFGVQKSAEIW